jgi:hypothetical protein
MVFIIYMIMKMTQISVINSLDNLQPLWANENLSKSNKI